MDPAATATLTPPSQLAGALQVSPSEADAIVGFGNAAQRVAEEALGALLAQPVRCGPVSVRRMEPSEIEQENWGGYHPIDIRWEIAGDTFSPVLLLPQAELQTLLPAARTSADLPDMEALGRVLRDLAGRLTAQLDQQLPGLRLWLPDASEATHDPNQPSLRVEHQLSAGHQGMQTDLTVIHLVPIAALQAVARNATSATNPPHTTAPDTLEPASGSTRAGGGGSDMEDHMASTAPAATSVHGVQFEPFDGEAESAGGTNIDLLLDVSLKVSVELGRTELAIKEVLALGAGSVIELDKLAGEPVDILVNNRLIAKGEVVVVDENFGVRVTDIISPQKLIGKLR